MVLAAPGYVTLATALTRRSDLPWLVAREPQARSVLWRGLYRLATGIRLLHEQYILHRNVSAETVFFSSDLGAPSLRLGGFEWSVRLGTPDTKAPPPGWSSPPEFFTSSTFGYRPETDWYGFGMVVARTLLNVESYATNEPIARHAKIVSEVERSGARISEVERSLVLRLIATDPRDRITRGYEVLAAIQDVVRMLQHGSVADSDTRPLVVAINQSANHDLVARSIELGFQPNPDRPEDPFNPNDPLHTAGLTNFIQQELAGAQLYAAPGVTFHLLVGGRFVLILTPFEYVDRDTNDTVRTWDVAFSSGLAELRWNDGGTACVDLPQRSVVVRTRKQVLTDRTIRQNARSWERFLPSVDKTAQLRANLARFHEFIRCTNQIELLIRDSEIFRYVIVERSNADGVERLTIQEAHRPRRPARFCELEGGLTEFLLREIESGKPDCRYVVLTGPDEDALTLPSVDKNDAWQVERVDVDSRRVELSRMSIGKKLAPAQSVGTIRTWGMFGQVALIRRRKRAIDRIETHSYLLRSLSAPGQVYMDTGGVPLPVPLSVDLVDEAKQAAIEDILRVRPIYALQGPPGTGKTTLVAHLLRQIFTDDRVAQVLITAQAHGAVDVLRSKVRDEAFKGVAEDDQPLAVRLGITAEDGSPQEGSVEEVSLQILERAKQKLEELAVRNPIQEAWLRAVSGMRLSLLTSSKDTTAPDFCEIVKRGANITYCTTSAGDLEVLADATQSFDWAIVEEAGKAHGFDLALPLQAGHRWLLIGDHKQLPPYRNKDYRDGIDALDEVVAALEDLPERAGNLLDFDWIRSWRDRAPEERTEFKDYARKWLKTFETIYEYCSIATGIVKRTLENADGAAAGMLSRQHRMHPTIGDLISLAYYKGELLNRTLDDRGQPLRRVQHSFSSPGGLPGKAILWLDIPWAENRPEYSEVGPATGHPRYTNPREVEALRTFIRSLVSSPIDDEATLPSLAVLSPYNQQVALINRTLTEADVRAAGLRLKPALRGKRRSPDFDTPTRVAHSVDSFQGNQADVIAVSLVRNNQLPIGLGLGFLDEASRINVLLSRAERLLVLVGSWQFFQHQLRAVVLDDENLPLWHWKKVLTVLEDWFRSGAALKVSVDQLDEVRR
jgi:KaiC/GvpD/RAD55 family RecA-like ATPase